MNAQQAVLSSPQRTARACQARLAADQLIAGVWLALAAPAAIPAITAAAPATTTERQIQQHISLNLIPAWRVPARGRGSPNSRAADSAMQRRHVRKN